MNIDNAEEIDKAEKIDNVEEIENSEYICQICIYNALHIAKHKSPNIKSPPLAKENTCSLENDVQCDETL